MHQTERTEDFWFSALVITRNAEEYLQRVLDRLKCVTDDIIMVDSGSSDSTLSIGLHSGVNVLEPGWLGYGESRNKGALQARYDWVLAIDSDEVLSDELISSLLRLRPQSNHVYVLDRKNYIGNRWIRRSGMYPDWKPRLYPKSEVRWDNKPVHEELIIPGHFTLTKIQGHLSHFTSRDMSQYASKLNYYSKLSAKTKFESGQSLGFLKTCLGACLRFVKAYFFQFGILDGKPGFEIARHQFLMILNRKKHFDALSKRQGPQ